MLQEVKQGWGIKDVIQTAKLHSWKPNVCAVELKPVSKEHSTGDTDLRGPKVKADSC